MWRTFIFVKYSSYIGRRISVWWVSLVARLCISGLVALTTVTLYTIVIACIIVLMLLIMLTPWWWRPIIVLWSVFTSWILLTTVTLSWWRSGIGYLFIMCILITSWIVVGSTIKDELESCSLDSDLLRGGGLSRELSWRGGDLSSRVRATDYYCIHM